jgi:hypothetical protein
VPDLFLDNGQREVVRVYVVHDMAVTQRVDRELMQAPPPEINAVDSVETGGADIPREDLTDAIL